MRFPPRHQFEGGLDVRSRRFDNGLYCLTEDAAVQLHRRISSFFVAVTIVAKRQHPTVIQVEMSALQVATSLFCRIYLNMGQDAVSTSSDYLALSYAEQNFFYKSSSYIYKSINPANLFTIYNPTHNNNTNNAYSITSIPRVTRVTRVISTVIYPSAASHPFGTNQF